MLKQFATLLLLAPLSGTAVAQNTSELRKVKDQLNLQLHGYVTQAGIYDTHNNWDTTNSTDGSAAWTEGVLTLAAQPNSHLRIGAQGRFTRLGNYGDTLRLDWASLDYRFNDHFGVRAGKVKTPTSLFNEVQDIDPALLWVLLPQSVYPVTSRSTFLAINGAVGYGAMRLGEKMGRVEYRAYYGERTVPSNDGYLYDGEHSGYQFPDGLQGRSFGGNLRWYTPVHGLMVGANEGSEAPHGPLSVGPLPGQLLPSPTNLPDFFGQYEHGRLMLASEYQRLALSVPISLPPYPVQYQMKDQRNFYVMGSFRIARAVNAGSYFSRTVDEKIPSGPARYQNDTALTVRYDINAYLYAKLEQHFLQGTEIGFSQTNNTAPSPSDAMTLVKLGVSF